jgi:hypothetical protein
MNATKWLPVIAACLLSFTCTNPVKDLENQFNKAPEISAVVRAIKACAPLGYAANCALDAVNKRPGPGVSVTARDADSFPCNAVVTIQVSKAHPLPVGGDSTGTIEVMGLFADSQSAVVIVFFTNTNITDGTFTLKNAAFVPVARDTGGTTVVFASEDINADSATIVTTKITDSMATVKLSGLPDSLPTDSALAVNQKAWITIVKEPASGYVLGNETYDLYGASQYLGVSPSTIEVIQAVMVAVEVTPRVCRKNPVSGYAMIRDMKIPGTNSNSNSDIELGTTILSFASTCNGSAKIPLATGVYLGRTGSTASLNLDR